MEALDLKKFVWLSKETKKSYFIIAITNYKSDDVVVYQEAKDSSIICICSVDDFCRQFEATYQISS